MTRAASPVTRLTTATRTNLNGILKGDGTSLGTVTVGSNLSYDGTTLSATGGGTPGGSSGQIQYNSGGAFAGAAFSAAATSGTLLTLTAGADTDVPLKLAGHGATQSGDLTQWYNLSAALRARVTAAAEFSNAVYTNSEQFGAGAVVSAAKDNSTAIGAASLVRERYCTAIGAQSVAGAAGATQCVAIGAAASATGNNGIVIGTNSSDTQDGATIGTSVTKTQRGIAIGVGVTATAGVGGVMGLNAQISNAGDLHWQWERGGSTTSGFTLQGYTTTTPGIDTFRIAPAWVDATHASRKSRALLYAFDAGGGRECIRLEASGSAAMLGLYGTAATIQYATTGTVLGYTGGGGTALTHSDTFTGNTGATAYTIGDVVRCLKLLGAMAA